MCFNPSPVRRVPSPNRYMAVARFCFCKNNKRTIDRTIRNSFELRGLYRRSYFGPRTCGGGITNVIEVGGVNQGFPFSPLMSHWHFRGLRDGVEYKFLLSSRLCVLIVYFQGHRAEFHTVQNSSRVRQKAGEPRPPTRNPRSRIHRSPSGLSRYSRLGPGDSECVCVYYCRTYYKTVRGGGEEESGGHVLCETTSRGLCG